MIRHTTETQRTLKLHREGWNKDPTHFRTILSTGQLSRLKFIENLSLPFSFE